MRGPGTDESMVCRAPNVRGLLGADRLGRDWWRGVRRWTLAAVVAGCGLSAPAAATATTAAAISAGTAHTCALTSASGVKCWGYNHDGELGDGTTTERATPVDVSGLASGVAAISAGGGQTCALTSAGGVKCWGYNQNGALGDGTTTERATPVDVSGLSSGVAAIDAGFEHTCALTSAGGVKCWGSNNGGELGDGTTENKTTPAGVSGLSSGVAAISAGSAHTCALTNASGVKCWGNNLEGQLGDGTTAKKTTPVDVNGLASGVAAISAGSYDTCALTSAGGVKCWGENDYGQLGDGTTAKKTTPVDVSGLAGGVAAISAGAEYACALTSAGGVKCWGEGEVGELGDGTTQDKPTPVNVSDIAIVACTTSTGTVRLSPGLSSTPAVQTMRIKDALSGCTGEPFTELTFKATLRTAGPVSCSVLTASGEAASGAATYKGTPTAKPSRGSGTLSVLLTEAPGAALSGEVTHGLYSERTFFGTVSESYAGAATCGTKKVKKGTFSGSAVSFE
jgi:Regulator of chromosome condensation (RCC1) repeat